MLDQEFYVLVLLGVNGSGKTTLANELKKTSNLNIPLINMDLVGRRPYSSIADYNEMMARNLQITRQMMEEKLENKESFMTELTLSTTNNLEFFKHVKQHGARLITIFTLTRDTEINMSRIAHRVKKGGHSVPSQKIKSRQAKLLVNTAAAIDESDFCFVFDNSHFYQHILLKTRPNEILILGIDSEADEWVQEHFIKRLDKTNQLKSVQYYTPKENIDLLDKIFRCLNQILQDLKVSFPHKN